MKYKFFLLTLILIIPQVSSAGYFFKIADKSYLASIYCATFGAWFDDSDCEEKEVTVPEKITDQDYIDSRDNTFSSNTINAQDSDTKPTTTIIKEKIVPINNNYYYTNTITQPVNRDFLTRQVDAVYTSIGRSVTNVSDDISSLTTTDIPEASNLYYTDGRVSTYLSGSTTLTSSLNYWSKSDTDLSYLSGNVGIGTSSPYAKLSVVGPVVAEYFHATSSTATSTFAGGLSVAGTSGLTVLQNGNVGIGTTSPYAKLSVVGQVVGSYFTATTTTASTFPYASTTAISSTGSAYFATSGGNVGIGTTSPGQKLSVAGDILGNNIIGSYFTATSTTASTFPYASTTALTVSGTGFFPSGIWNSSGKVGIGTTSPDSVLTVRGSTSITGGLVVGANAHTGDFVQFSDTFDETVVNTTNWTVTGTNFVQYGVLGGRGNGASWSANGVTGTQGYRRNKVLTFSADIIPGTSADFMVGLSSSASSLNYTNMPHAIRFVSNGTTQVYENGVDRGSTGTSWVASTTYRIKIVVNPTGAIYYRSSDDGDTWTRLYDGTANNVTTSPLYASLTAVGTGFMTIDNVSISSGFDVLTASQLIPKNLFLAQGSLTVATTTATSTFAGGVTLSTTAGNVGIGTASPTSKLHVTGQIAGDNFIGTGSASSTFAGIISGAVGSNLTLNTNSANNLILQPSGGKVSIGPGTASYAVDIFGTLTSGQENALRINSAADYGSIAVNSTKAGGTGQANVLFQKAGVNTHQFGVDFANTGTKDFFEYDATLGTNAFYLSSIGDVRLGSAGTTGTGGYWNTQKMTIVASTGNVGIGETAPGSRLSVSGGATIGASYDTTAAPTNGLLVEGNVGLGSTSPASKLGITQSANTSAGGIWLAGTDGDYRSIYMSDTSGTLSFAGGDTAGASNIATLNSAGAWTNASDRSYKEEIVNLDTKYNLETLMKIEPRYYTMKGSGKPQIGFIAQELKLILPEVVEGEEGSMGISYGNMVALLVTAIKEINVKVGKITSDIKAMFAEKVETKKLCLEDVCITKEELQKILNSSSTSAVINSNSNSNTNNSNNSTPVTGNSTTTTTSSSPEPTPTTSTTTPPVQGSNNPGSSGSQPAEIIPEPPASPEPTTTPTPDTTPIPTTTPDPSPVTTQEPSTPPAPPQEPSQPANPVSQPAPTPAPAPEPTQNTTVTGESGVSL